MWCMCVPRSAPSDASAGPILVPATTASLLRDGPKVDPTAKSRSEGQRIQMFFCIFIFKNTFLPLEHARIRGPVSPLQGFTVFLTIYCTASISTLEWAPIQVRPNCLTSVILWKLVFPTWFSYSVVFFWNFSFFGWKYWFLFNRFDSCARSDRYRLNAGSADGGGNKGGSGTFIKQNIFDSHYFRSVAFSFYIFYY